MAVLNSLKNITFIGQRNLLTDRIFFFIDISWDTLFDETIKNLSEQRNDITISDFNM